MSIVEGEYEFIEPHISYLSNIVILSQAWKKSNSYIRRYNWYADILELDCATVDLERKLSDWAEQLKNKQFQTDKLRLVLAPKNWSWLFLEDDKPEATFNSWSSITKEKKGESELPKLRPLAHLTIKDQTAATAVMLCLADAIETIQGPTEEKDFLNAQLQRIFSYGNRLHCNWETFNENTKKATFGWGNSQCYRQYYQDYRTFLSRPKSICQGYASSLSPHKNLYVVSLDLKEFYDHIDIDALILQLKNLYKEYSNKFKISESVIEDKEFWNKTKEIFHWEWDENDLESKGTQHVKKLPKGLPQGLVASGFLSNAYLINFDRKVGALINTLFDDKNITLLDYCRYVDDIRLVIEVPTSLNEDAIRMKVSNTMQKKLNKYQDEIGASETRIELNKDKTKIIPYRQLFSQNHVSAKMNMIQGVLSGTPDAESLRQATGGLEGLLGISEQLEEGKQILKNPLDLSRITTPNADVRDDTIKRFAATRMVKSLRLRRSMTNLDENLGKEVNDLENITAGKILDHEFEATARKLIYSWALNPSLTLLLKCGLDLYPNPSILIPVLDALSIKLFPTSMEDTAKSYIEICVAEYICADLLRASAIEIGNHSDNVYPESSDIQGFREELGSFARRLLHDRKQSPWFVKQQAILFLISAGDYGFSLDDKDKQEVGQYVLLQDIGLYRSVNGELKDILTVSLIIQQIKPNPRKYVSWFIEIMEKLKDSDQYKAAIKLVFMNRPDLMNQIIKSHRTRHVDWLGVIPSDIKEALKSLTSKEIMLSEKRAQSLLKIVQSNKNPFVQENALLLLTQAILNDPLSYKKLSSGVMVSDISVECKSWDEIQRLKKGTLKIKFFTSHEEDHFEIRTIPKWISTGNEWLYALGRILRSCITGEYDFTSNAFIVREDLGIYKGIKSTRFTRRFGLSNHPQGLLNEPIPISPWLSEFLIRLLQWPGVKQWGDWIKNFDQVRHPGDLIKIVNDRISYQKKIYGRLSETPFYTLPITTTREKLDGKMQIAVVQPLLPKMSDFNEKDPLHWTPAFRALHRNHIASICNLVNSQLKATRSADHALKINEQQNFEKNIDLIVFPELTVHPDDIDLLRGLSDATKSSIYTGLTFIKSKHNKKPINQALWLLRSERSTGREFINVYQGKKHMTKSEVLMDIESHRPYQVLVELGGRGQGIKLAGSICYDATDLSLVADLRDVSDLFVIAAMNQDVQTFDNMVTALQYHMYQPIVLANTGEFGGSTAQAPFNRFARQIAHVHGNNQVAVSIFEVDVKAFSSTKSPLPKPDVKTPPAGYKGRG